MIFRGSYIQNIPIFVRRLFRGAAGINELKKPPIRDLQTTRKDDWGHVALFHHYAAVLFIYRHSYGHCPIRKRRRDYPFAPQTHAGPGCDRRPDQGQSAPV